jgi:hypothetical protein
LSIQCIATRYLIVNQPAAVPHRPLHRATFIAAGVYNLLWGAFTVLNPDWIFRLADEPSTGGQPVFACLGMVLALYLRPLSPRCVALLPR